ncbi:MAG: HAD-IIB family hydrolase [Erysipelotrichaceae bacterium]|nr:HAD-IIB family hydrolase [Erysipelotrichaceae bacterium]
MIKLIATDLDGTLFTKENKKELIEKENIKVLQRFHNKNGIVAVVTGRGPIYCDYVSNKLGFKCYDLSLNGSLNGFNHLLGTIDDRLIDVLKKRLKKFNKPYIMIVSGKDGVLYSFKNKFFFYMSSFLKKRRKKYVNKLSKINFKKNLNIEICKVLIYFQKHDDLIIFKEEILDLVKEATFYFYKEGIEISPLGCNKGNAVLNLINNLGIDKNEVLVIGDSYNDLSMFELFNNSISFSYAEKEVQAKAKNIIDEFMEIENYLY